MIFLFEKNIRFLTRRRIKYIRLQETDKRTFLIWKTILHERKGISKYSFRVIFHKYTGHPLSFSSFHDSLQYRYIYIHTSSVNFERIHTGMDIFWQSVNFENVNCVTGSDLPRGGEGREKISDMPVSRHAKRWTRRARCFRNGAQCASIKKNSHPPPSQKYG